MVHILESPAAGSHPSPDLSSAETRARLTPAALEGYLKLAEIWRLTSAQATALLGENSERSWFRMKAGEWPGTLSQDALTRISGLVGIYKGLHIVFSNPLADEWVKLENSLPPFSGMTPVKFMLAGGIPAILQTREHIDAVRGGL